jgi:hypothetical protein
MCFIFSNYLQISVSEIAAMINAAVDLALTRAIPAFTKAIVKQMKYGPNDGKVCAKDIHLQEVIKQANKNKWPAAELGEKYVYMSFLLCVIE